MTRAELCTALALPADAATPTIRARVARVATGRPEMGSSPVARATLSRALRLQPGHGDLAIVRVVESILTPHPLDYRRELHVGTVDARGARTI